MKSVRSDDTSEIKSRNIYLDATDYNKNQKRLF